MSNEKEPFVREIRINPVVPQESVLVSTERGQRPKRAEAPAPRDNRSHVESCPFCSGNEDRTPPAIFTYPENGPWEIRIVENLYPVLGDDRNHPNLSLGLQQIIDGYGRHEVVIDHNQHGVGISDMSTVHVANLFAAFRQRTEDLFAADPRLRYVLIFKNFGPAAGASIAHTHSQLVAMPVVPENVHAELVSSRDYFGKHYRCIFCTLIDEALSFETTIYDRASGEVRRRIDVGQYVVERGEHFIAIKPFASRFEWEVHILPLNHEADFLALRADSMADLASVLQRTLARLDQVLGGAQYNFFVHTLPHDPMYADCRASYHWHIEICPRTEIPSGFELGSGLFVNTVSPEEAAQRLRDVNLDDIPGNS